MQITFDPHNAQECATIARLLGTTAQPETDQTRTPDIKGSGTYDDPLDYSGVKTVECPVPAHYDTAPAQPDTAPAQPDTAPSATDCHGMTHDDAIHSTPPSFNADGSYRAKRGQKEAYDAAVAAAKGSAPTPAAPAPAAPTPAAPQGMPMPNPASTALATPPAPIDYKTMAERFMAKMSDPDGLPAEYEAIYTALSIGYDDLETNQTSIARLSAYMDAVGDGESHDGCVRHAMSA